jgi:hypothetical protein
MLPFHHACLNPSSTVSVLTTFVKLYPECILPAKTAQEKGFCGNVHAAEKRARLEKAAADT